MAITTEYKCDRCKKVVDGGESLMTVGIFTIYHGYKHSIPLTRIEKSEHWCIECRIEKGIERPHPAFKAKPEDPAPTVEDLIREIVREEVQDTVGDR